MSIEAMTAVLPLPIGGNAKVVLLGIANHAHPDLTEARPSVPTLARYACCDDRTVQRHLRQLERDGWIEQTGWYAIAGRADRRVAVWRLLTGRQSVAPQNGRGDTGDANGVTVAPPEPSFNRPIEERGRAGVLMKINGKPVDGQTWAVTCAVLEAFNREAGRSYGATTGTGQPSETAKRIYGRVREHPELDLAQFEDIIRRTLRSRWWGTGEPSVGVVFGPRVFEDNMTRRGEPSSGREVAAEERRARSKRRGDALRRLANERGVEL